MACSAVMYGSRSFAAIGQWARKAPQDTLARLGARSVCAFAVCIAPSAATIRRIINRVCPGGLADLLGCDPSEADTLAVDGKSARGSRHGETPAAPSSPAYRGDPASTAAATRVLAVRAAPPAHRGPYRWPGRRATPGQGVRRHHGRRHTHQARIRRHRVPSGGSSSALLAVRSARLLIGLQILDQQIRILQVGLVFK